MNCSKLTASLSTLVLAVFSFTLYSCSSSSSSTIAPQFSNSSLTQGSLFAATSNPGKIYSYVSGANWEAVSEEMGASVDAIAFYGGQLYAAASLNELTGPSVISRYTGGKSWVPVSNHVTAKITSLSVFKGQLYAAAINSSANNGQLFRFDSDKNWTLVADSKALSDEWQGFKTLYPTNDHLYIGASNTDYLARFDGTSLEQVSFYSGAGIKAMDVFQNELFAGAADGWIYQTTDGNTFTQNHSGIYPSNIWSIKAFNDQLYIGMDSSADGPGKEQLYRWKDGSPELIWENEASGMGDGVISMTTNGDVLYFGTGMATGYFEQPGNGVVYAFDGEATTAISGRLGNGINQLLINEISLPTLEITNALASPTPMLAGGTFLAYITLRNAGNADAFLYEGGFKSISGLPEGWYGEFIDTGSYNASWEATTLIQAGGTASVVVAITVPCGIAPGTYSFIPKLSYGFGDANVVISSSQDYSPNAIEIKDMLQDGEMSFYRHAQGAVRQIRAFDRNIESGVITTAINLTFIGIDGVQKTVTLYAAGGRAYRSVYDYGYAGEVYHQDDYYKETTAYAYAEKSETRYQSKIDDYNYYSLVDSRPYYTFDFSAIPGGSSIVSAELMIYTGYGALYDGDFYVDVYSMENDPASASAQAVFEDTGNGTLYIDNMRLQPNSTIIISLGQDFLSKFGNIASGASSIGIKLDKAASSTDTYEDDNAYYHYTYSSSSIFTSYGTNPAVTTDTIQYTSPEEALHIMLNWYLEGRTTEAGELANYINEKYYSIGFWGLAPGRDECSEGNGIN